MTAQEARTHIRYSGWASRKVMKTVLALSPEDRAKPMGVSHESIAKTLISTSPMRSGIPVSPTPAIPCHLTTLLPRSISSLKNASPPGQMGSLGRCGY